MKPAKSSDIEELQRLSGMQKCEPSAGMTVRHPVRLPQLAIWYDGRLQFDDCPNNADAAIDNPHIIRSRRYFGRIW